MNSADWVLLGLVGLSLVIGLWRGFIKEVFALAVWVLAFLLAFQYSGLAAGYLENLVELPSARTALGFGGIFLVTLVVGGLLTWLLSKLVHTTGLSGTDRFMGAVFGAMRGVLLILVLVVVARFTPLPEDPWWQESRVITALTPLSEWLTTLMPDSVREIIEPPPEAVEVKASLRT
jgi:membrane protein required for colicin V production